MPVPFLAKVSPWTHAADPTSTGLPQFQSKQQPHCSGNVVDNHIIRGHVVFYYRRL